MLICDTLAPDWLWNNVWSVKERVLSESGGAARTIKGAHSSRCHSSLASRAVMSHQPRVLNEADVKEMVEDLRNILNLCSKLLEKIAEGKRPLSQKIFNLEFGLISPLYYRLQWHLIDWGTRDHHPHLSYLEITKQLDREGKKFCDYLVCWGIGLGGSTFDPVTYISRWLTTATPTRLRNWWCR